MIRYCVFLFCILFIGIHSLSAQEEIKVPKNLIKLNIISALFKTTTINYERTVGNRSSFMVGYGRKFSGSLPGILNQNSPNLTLTQSNLIGNFINLDYRWYINKCEDESSLFGFYLGPYFKYNRYRMDFDMSFDGGTESFENNGTSVFQEYGIGLSMGYQLKVNKRIVVDFIFFGPRTSRFDIKLEFEDALTEDFTNAVVDKINSTVDKIYMKEGIDPEFSVREIVTNFNWFSFRYAISIGYSF